jgi:NAD(P)-dependent dehydrogenase (short-subunit alcohol dehydrogenase family)
MCAELLLKNRVCVVTGAAKSIGLGIAEAFCNAGAAVAMIDIAADEVCRQAERLKSAGAKTFGCGLDITDREAVQACFKRIAEELGPVDVLVNNAGVVDQRPFEEITPEQMDRMMRVNVGGTLWCCQAAAPGMKSKQWGRIINFSSKSGKTGSALMAHYSAAKGAIIALTHALAFELAPHNVLVNCLCPGITDATGVWSNVSSGYIHNLKMPREDVVKKFTAKVPLGRLTNIEDVVAFVMFLVTAGNYCTGQAFNISGGREVH